MAKRREIQDVDQQDALFAKAADYVQKVGEGSASDLQRALHIGYPRAGKLIDQLRTNGILSEIRNPGTNRLLTITKLQEIVEKKSQATYHPFQLPELPPVKPKDLNGWQSWLLIPDLHSPYYDTKAVEIVLGVLKSKRWTGVAIMGDAHDWYQISRFDKDPQRLACLQDDLDVTIALLRLIAELAREARKIFIPGNHEGRLPKHLSRNSPAMASLRTNNIDVQLQLSQHGYEIIPRKRKLHLPPGIMVTHGAGKDDDGCHLSMHSGWSAKRNHEKFWSIGFSAHTHRLGTFFVRHGDNVTFWYECGCLCDIQKVSDDYAVEANWQHGFCVLHIKGVDVHAELVPILNHQCIFEGKLFKA